MNFKIIVLLALIPFLLLIAHEGHNHDAPKMLLPLRGGTIMKYDAKDAQGNSIECFVEVSKSKNELKIYFMNAAKEIVSPKDFQVTIKAFAYLNGQKQKEVDLEGSAIEEGSKKKFIKTNFDKGKAQRYELQVSLKGPAYCNANENITFNQ